ncbi:MAG: hypothetical protein HRU34_21980 [Richelia sp.]|nr:hypothetical protein [Richelia sp.]
MSIHLLTFACLQQISNLSEQRCWILQFFGAPCRKYYLLCELTWGMWVEIHILFSIEIPNIF